MVNSFAEIATVMTDTLERLSDRLKAQEKKQAEAADVMISRKEAMKMLGVGSPSTMTQWKKRGYLKSVTVGNREQYSLNEVKALLRTRGDEF